MTCIVGYIDNNDIYMGGDSAGVSGLNITVRADEKVFKNGEFIFGCTTSFRMEQILRYNFIPPERKENITDDQYLYGDFLDGIMRILKDKYYAKLDSNQIEGGRFLFGYRGKLYMIDSDFQIAKPLGNYFAVGCGAHYALGCLYALEKVTMKAKDKVKLALETAEHYSGGVRGPFIIEKLEEK